MGRLIRRVARGKLLDPIPQDDYKQLQTLVSSRPDNAYFIRDMCTRGVVLTFTTANYARCFIILHMLFNDGPINFIKQVDIQRKTGMLDHTPLDPKNEDKPLAISDKTTAQMFVPYFAYLRMRLSLQERFGTDFLRQKLDNKSITLDTLMNKKSPDALPPKYVEMLSTLLDMTNTILKIAPCPQVLYPVLSRDLSVLFSLLSDGLTTILSVFTSLSLPEAAHGLLIYKNFVALNVTSQTSRYLNMSVPQIDETLTKTIESWLRSEQLSRAVPLPNSPPESLAESVNGSPKSAKSTQIISNISHRQFQRNPASVGLQEPSSVSLSPPKSVYSARSSSLLSHRKNISFDFSETVAQNVSRFIEQSDSDEEEAQAFPIFNAKLSDRTITGYLTQESDDTNSNGTDQDSSSASSATTTTGSPTFVITSTPPKSPRDSDELLECFNDPECEPSPKVSLRKMRPPQLNLTRDVDYDDNVGIAFLKSASSDSSDWSEIFSPLENDSKVCLSFTPSTIPSSPHASTSSMGLAVGYPDTGTSAGSTYSQRRWKRFFSRN
ncbi:YALIA101S01e13916g1_1 [Yarrowia lipolytica]|nr:YALIA101S01e13916g1_1 [Yarrowia lipolytica]